MGSAGDEGPLMTFRFGARLVVAAFCVLSVLSASATAGAIPMDPIVPDEPPPDDGGGGGGETGGGTYAAPGGSFTWTRLSRFPTTDPANFHWDAGNAQYDQNWVNPKVLAFGDQAVFPVRVNGCGVPEGTSGYTYQWEKVLVGGGAMVLSGPNADCYLDLRLPEGQHQIQLKVSGSHTATYSQSVTVNDILIVSIGDSYASGEGSPDMRKTSSSEARWVDERCHRSGYAGPAQAAKAIEQRDSLSSVTFLSFACSGATIERFFHQPKDPTRPYDGADPTKPVGIGVLGTYAGADSGTGDGQQEANYASHLPPQIQQVKNAIGQRKIDAFIISGGGNDIGFGPVASVCTLVDRCWDHPTENGGGTKAPLHQILAGDVAKLPGMFSNLAACLQPGKGACYLRDRSNTPKEAGFHLGLNPADIYLTEYPNQIKDDDGTTCTQILEDALGWGFRIDKDEANWAASKALGTATTGGLNGHVKQAAAAHGWTFVDRVAEQFAGAGVGHGYCATNNWIRRAAESDVIQGGGTSGTKGTLHPNERGHQVYRDRLVAHMVPRLFAAAPANTPPVFSTTNAYGATAARVGDGGWFTGRCDGATCLSDWAGVTVKVTDPGGILSARAALDETLLNCDSPPAGILCSYSAGDGNTSTWTVGFTNSGLYRLEFGAAGVDGQSETFSRDVKVDLEDPTTGATRTCTRVSGLCRSAVKVNFTAGDSAGGSRVSHIAYRLDGAVAKGIAAANPLYIRGLGTHTLKYRTIDFAGRRSIERSLSERIVAPTATQVGVVKRSDFIRTPGSVNKAAVAGQKVKVVLYRKSSGRWKVLQTGYPTLSRATSRSIYSTSFTRPRRGSCKVVSTYLGEDRYLRSSGRQLFDC